MALTAACVSLALAVVHVAAARQCSAVGGGTTACSQTRSDVLMQVTTQRATIRMSANSPHAHAVIEAATKDIVDLVRRRAGLAAKLLRLGVHDCVGGCDGCMDMANPDNKGLEMPISVLEGVVQSATGPGSPLSRADIWALATMVAVQESVHANSGFDFAFGHYGRVNCEDSAECAPGGCGTDPSRGGPPRDLPSPNLDTAGVLKYFNDTFGFNATQTVALMGAHGIGKTHLENSGFGVEGKRGQSIGWAYNNRRIGRDYYDVLIGHTPEDTFYATDWIQYKIDNSALRAGGDWPPDRIQWEHQKKNDSRILVMLNSDIALVRDFGGHVDLASGNATCNFRGNRTGDKNNTNKDKEGEESKQEEACPEEEGPGV